MLAVVILFFLTSTIIPLTHNMKQQIATQKVQAHAAEVAYMGALKYTRYNEPEGKQQIDDTVFRWEINGDTICVAYEKDEVQEEFCV